MSEVVAFLAGHLEADAALATAALSEPDDDTYLAVEARAKAFYAAHDSPLGPRESRWAVPGGTTPTEPIDADSDADAPIRPAPLYAVGHAGDRAWIALAGDKRDDAGVQVAEALLVRETPDGLRVTGRAALDPFSPGLAWEADGGEPVDLASARDVQVLRTPTSPVHRELVERWGTA